MTEAASAHTVGSDPHAGEALAVVKRFSTWSAIGGVIPIPFVDVLAVGGVQLEMLRRLAAIYGVPFSANSGKSVVASLIGATFPATTTLTAAGAVSALKAVPVLGAAVGTVMMPTLSAGATYVIGKVFMQHFASGGTLLDFHAPDYREFVRATSGSMGGRFTRAAPAEKSAEV